MTDNEILERVKHYTPHWCDRCAIFHGYEKDGMPSCPVCEYDERKRKTMELNDYQNAARSTAIYPNLGNNFLYPTLGLCGESGEIAEKMKKVIRDSNGHMSEEKKIELCKELGDVLWYVANLASELGLALNDVATLNVAKLKSRADRGVLKGSGDNR